MKATFELPVASDVALWIVHHHRPGISESDLSFAMYGKRDQPLVHQDCDLLERRSLVRRDRNVRPLALFPA